MSGGAMSTASSTSHGGSMMMSMQDMMMVFFTGTQTPLYSTAWTPSSTGQYAGTCIFLIVLAVIFRAILAIRSVFPRDRYSATLLGPDHDKPTVRTMEFTTRGIQARPWTAHEAVSRAALDVVLAGVSYLLMLAVMTMNVGYFLSILGGTFLGSFAFGSLTGVTSH
ncbi:hypothetical protein PV08_02885 [Exophiala spinifera]|uniref:Copper transport protein n=1 Tax=Exophiala spinifera TaxID=91928 RepID=A0A0D1YTN9_9EURO|nr:uncharacterized protein PV08_02885 [Exophiala spinifera]KIW18596.1 hypothetical protein PV08_02885 [Exophiala spinifera]